MEYNTSNYFFKQYKELKLSLAAAKSSLKVYEKELNILIYDGPKDVKGYDASKIKASFSLMPLMERYNKISELSALIANTKIYIKEIEIQLESLADEVETMASNFNDLELTVFNLRHIKGMKLIDIADETGYSFIHIRRINSQLNKKMSQN